MNTYSETYELCLLLCDLDPNSDDDFNDETKVDKILYEKYGIEDTEGLDELIRDLAKLIDIGISPFSKKRYKGFSKGNELMQLVLYTPYLVHLRLFIKN